MRKPRYGYACKKIIKNAPVSECRDQQKDKQQKQRKFLDARIY